MCGRYSITADGQQVAMRFGVQVAGDWQAHYNAAPSQSLPVILNSDPQSVQWLRWGLVPHWAKDPSIGNKMINARAETLLEKPSFREPLRKRRCLVLADGYYEWQATAKGKQPMRFVLDDGQPFAMAGLWEEWRGGETPLATFSVITTSANAMAAAVHNRMPVILAPETERDWLNPEIDVADLLPLLTPFAGEKMSVYPVSTRLNSPSNDDPSLIARV
ncbi:SOS response-associated peptidase [Herpetosiphon geysericola]|uniref:Abasic site processing protein n=1 Tax=Herpetosiphon geysericola TaxID=70996 RepID=A0A0P6YLN8_9CHLR|nr:SOS response-associated peptidase [Herpetosiphon geysericola]KPL90950.1 hypothetical protein SE18_04045 [Herpetosiphon geysericola]